VVILAGVILWAVAEDPVRCDRSRSRDVEAR
jgi:hypothetical protein